MKDVNKIEMLLLKRLSGDSTPKENVMIDCWIGADGKNGERFSELKKLYDDAEWTKNDGSFNPDRSWERIGKRIQRSKSFKLRPLLRLAASVALLIAVGLSGLFLLRNEEAGLSDQIFSTDIGEQSRIVLADGTQVFLNVESELHYPEKFSDGVREVTLEGEAYFDVAHDSENPFIVHIGNASIKVLGTSFIASSYHNDQMISTTLIRGSVVVIRGQQVVQLSPNEKLCMSKTGDYQKMGSADISAESAWKEGLIVFNNTRFSEIAKRLERYYEYEFLYHPELAQRSFTGTFTRDDDIGFILDLFMMSEPIEYNIKDHTVYIREKVLLE